MAANPVTGDFLAAWTEWRALLIMAAANGLQTALTFYGLDGKTA